MGKQEFAHINKEFSKLGLHEVEESEENFLNCCEIEGGMGGKSNYAKYREGSDTRMYQRNVLGICDVDNIKFKKGISLNNDFMYNWFFASCVKGKDISIKVLNINVYSDDGKTKCIGWEVYNAKPVSYWGASLSSIESKILFEEIEVCHEGVIRVSNTMLLKK